MASSLPIFRRISSIENLGVFGKRAISTNTPDFKFLNLVYGFNGSGKTTISRIFLSISKKSLHQSLPSGGRLVLELSDNSQIDSSTLALPIADRVLVFNVDFIDDNIRWRDGTANPVYYIGKLQADLSIRLEQAQKELGRIVAEEVEAQRIENSINAQFIQHKQDLARLIAEELNLGRRYTAIHLVSDYGQFTEDQLTNLSEDDRRRQRFIISQESALPKITPLEFSRVDLVVLFCQCVEVLNTSVSDGIVKDLQQHTSMLAWIKRGLDYHEEEHLDTCILCGHELHKMRIDTLRRCIDNKLDNLMHKIEVNAQRIQSIRANLVQLRQKLPSVNDVCFEYQREYAGIGGALAEAIDEIGAVIEIVLACLQAKSVTPSIILGTDQIPNESKLSALELSLNSGVSNANDIIVRHNQSHDEFSTVKEKAKEFLKRHYLSEKHKYHTGLVSELENARAAVKTLADSRVRLTREVESIKAEMRQHGPAGEYISHLLSLYIGHNELQVAPLEAGYSITRKGRRISGPLSEGEKSALALCYFISMLRAEDRDLRNLILVIDDPVSSLDCNALNYAFAFLKNTVNKAAQVIILTHNLQFMNETKKWLKPKIVKDDAAIFYIDQTFDLATGERKSLLVEMPKYLREYESEYHFLFKLLLDFHGNPNAQDTLFHVMPNAMRKVLDIYLAFKIPGSSGLAAKVESLISKNNNLDANRLRALDRLIQLESHADNLDDLVSFSSMTVEESRAAAGSLLRLIEQTDTEHYGSMCSLCK
jgi:wobble nucleotide-excising tRNase